MSEHRFTAATLTLALDRAAEALECSHEELAYRVIEERPGHVEIEASADPVAVLGLFLRRTFEAGGLAIETSITEMEDVLEGQLSGADAGLLTRSGGEGLDALQYLANRVLDARVGRHPAVRLDSDGFKAHRRRRLAERAVQEAERAVATGRPVRLEPMSPAARREIHVALADDGRVETESDGTGFFKRVVIRPRRR